ncbi:arabinosylfuranosidase ArfA [Deinococcus roseus]|uniref:non-reducing end alpha-L-arabinofuranosidase n=1 Tax=Deinococcus roseus TaxID=392414 RepID=A0ABQ2DF45_9DEIO|nr:alpha-N-arabinofuranosidase [Deinococcus roseus]GGJ53508.1 alpha-N-arabinofuranosidase [Deinococcus roseus]
MKTATIYLDTRRTISDISPYIFGGFAEHMGRCVYEGIYDPKSPLSDENGIRRDVMEALKELNFRSIRYPGGNFVSGYNWEDGIGPRENRPVKRDLAWRSIETNQFGTDEFMKVCSELGTEPMMAVNLGTGSIQDAANIVEYCNLEAGTKYSDLRIQNGSEQPYGVKFWCLGNEMDGPWQVGQLSAEDYSKKAVQAAKAMKLIDPSIQLIACGSSSSEMNSYPDWDRVVLEETWDQIDYLSMHYYAYNRDDDTGSYLGYTRLFEQHLNTIAATIQYVKAKKRSKKDVFISWDEWNVWYREMNGNGDWQQAPHILEEVYNLEDALVVAQWMNVFLKHADVLKMASLAQVVNVIAPIMTRTDGMFKQTIYYPFLAFSKHASGQALSLNVLSDTYETRKHGAVDVLDASASFDPEKHEGTVFLVNRNQNSETTTEIVFQSEAPRSVKVAYQLSGTDPKAQNSFEDPENLVMHTIAAPEVKDGKLVLSLPALSFTAVVLEF